MQTRAIVLIFASLVMLTLGIMVGVATHNSDINLDADYDTDSVLVQSSAGDDVILRVATESAAGVMSASDRRILDDLAAQINQRLSTLLANGQAASNITVTLDTSTDALIFTAP